MHGVADDNVHMQNSLVLLDKLDLEGVENYDVHVFPDSDHGIFFHNARTIVFDSKSIPPLLMFGRCVNKVCRIIKLAYQRVQRRVAQDCQCPAQGVDGAHRDGEGEGEEKLEEAFRDFSGFQAVFELKTLLVLSWSLFLPRMFIRDGNWRLGVLGVKDYHMSDY